MELEKEEIGALCGHAHVGWLNKGMDLRTRLFREAGFAAWMVDEAKVGELGEEE